MLHKISLHVSLALADELKRQEFQFVLNFDTEGKSFGTLQQFQ